MAASSEAFKSFKSVGVVVFADSKKDTGSLPKGVMEVRNKGGNTIPMVFVTTADGQKGLEAIPYSVLKEDVRKATRNLRKTLEGVDVLGGGAVEEDVEKEIADTPEFTEWQNSAGKTIRAAVKEVKDGKVLFLLPNGKTVNYDISKLSEASQLKLSGK